MAMGSNLPAADANKCLIKDIFLSYSIEIKRK